MHTPHFHSPSFLNMFAPHPPPAGGAAVAGAGADNLVGACFETGFLTFSGVMLLGMKSKGLSPPSLCWLSSLLFPPGIFFRGVLSFFGVLTSVFPLLAGLNTNLGLEPPKSSPTSETFSGSLNENSPSSSSSITSSLLTPLFAGVLTLSLSSTAGAAGVNANVGSGLCSPPGVLSIESGTLVPLPLLLCCVGVGAVNMNPPSPVLEPRLALRLLRPPLLSLTSLCSFSLALLFLSSSLALLFLSPSLSLCWPLPSFSFIAGGLLRLCVGGGFPPPTPAFELRFAGITGAYGMYSSFLTSPRTGCCFLPASSTLVRLSRVLSITSAMLVLSLFFPPADLLPPAFMRSLCL